MIKLKSRCYKVKNILYKTQSKTWKNIKQDDIISLEYSPTIEYTHIKVCVYSNNLDEKLSFEERVSMLKKFLSYFELVNF